MKKVWMLGLLTLAACQPETSGVPAAPGVQEAAPVSAPVAAPQAVEAPATPAAQPAAVPAMRTEPPKAVQAAAEKSQAVVAPQVTAQPAASEPQKVAEPVPVVAPSPQPVVSEADALALAKKKNCFACHALDKKVVGPAWRDVAAKYRADGGSQAYLEVKMIKGGKGVWGSVAMPPQPALSTGESAQLARFILSLK